MAEEHKRYESQTFTNPGQCFPDHHYGLSAHLLMGAEGMPTALLLLTSRMAYPLKHLA